MPELEGCAAVLWSPGAVSGKGHARNGHDTGERGSLLRLLLRGPPSPCHVLYYSAAMRRDCHVYGVF